MESMIDGEQWLVPAYYRWVASLTTGVVTFSCNEEVTEPHRVRFHRQLLEERSADDLVCGFAFRNFNRGAWVLMEAPHAAIEDQDLVDLVSRALEEEDGTRVLRAFTDGWTTSYADSHEAWVHAEYSTVSDEERALVERRAGGVLDDDHLRTMSSMTLPDAAVVVLRTEQTLRALPQLAERFREILAPLERSTEATVWVGDERRASDVAGAWRHWLGLDVTWRHLKHQTSLFSPSALRAEAARRWRNRPRTGLQEPPVGETSQADQTRERAEQLFMEIDARATVTRLARERTFPLVPTRKQLARLRLDPRERRVVGRLAAQRAKGIPLFGRRWWGSMDPNELDEILIGLHHKGCIRWDWGVESPQASYLGQVLAGGAGMVVYTYQAVSEAQLRIQWERALDQADRAGHAVEWTGDQPRGIDHSIEVPEVEAEVERQHARYDEEHRKRSRSGT